MSNFLIGLFIGALVGVFVVALFSANGRDEGYQPNHPPAQPPKPPTTGSNAQKPKTIGFVLGTDIAEVARVNRAIGYKRGVEDFAERAKKNASWPEVEEMHIGDIDDTLAEMLKELEEADQ